MADTQRIYQIQILRFVAAAMVLISHLQHHVVDRRFLDMTHFKPFEPVVWSGGVDVFFIISGFIMYHLSRNRFGQDGAPGRFMLRRLIRVVPPYWAATIAMLLAMLLFKEQIRHSDPSLQQLIGSFLFVPVPDPYGRYYPVMILGWTLNFEMLFYTVFALGLFFRRSVGLTIIIVCFSILGLIRFAIPVDIAPFAFWANPIVFEFLFGIGLARLRETGVRVSPGIGWLLFGLGIAAMVVFQATGLTQIGAPYRPIWMGLPALLTCAGPALIRETRESSPGPVTRALVFGGDISFALYLSHPFSISLVAMLAQRLGLHDPWIYIVVTGAFAILASALVYLLAERPVTNWLDRALTGRRSAVLAQVPSA